MFLRIRLSFRTGFLSQTEQCVCAPEIKERVQMTKTADKEARKKKVEQEIKGLIGASRKRLKATWKSLYGTDAPEQMSEDHLKRAIAHRIQENAFGGLKLATRKLLDRVADDASARKPIRTS